MAWIRSGYGGASYPETYESTIALTLSQEFVGQTVTCTYGTNTTTFIPISTNYNMVVDSLGGYTFSCTLNGYEYVQKVSVKGFNKTFNATLEYFDYIFNVTYPPEVTCTMYQANVPVGSIAQTSVTAPSSAGGNYAFHAYAKSCEYYFKMMSGSNMNVTTGSYWVGDNGGSRSLNFTSYWGTLNVSLDQNFVGLTIKCALKTNSGVYRIKIASDTNLIFKINNTGTWVLSTTYNGLAYTKEVTVLSLATPVSVTFAPTPLYAFETATDSQLSDMIDAYYNGDIGLSHIQSVWNIGDTRTIHLDSMNATGVGESHRAQDVQIQILDFNHDELTTPINNIDKALITVDLKNCLRDASVTDTTGSNNTECGYMNTTHSNTRGWAGCARHTWCNEIFYNALPTYLKDRIKTVDKYTNTKTTSTTVVANLPGRHPYSNNENYYYHITVDLTPPIYITLNDQSYTESASYDYLRFYVQDGDKYKYFVIGGSSIGGKTYKLDTNEFWLYWRSDGSQCTADRGYWGWQIDSITSDEKPYINMDSAWTTNQDLPSSTWEDLSLSNLVGISNDKTFLLSEVEVFGNTTYSINGEGSQYSWYATAAANRYKLPGWDTSNPNSSRWWERSPLSSSSYGFCIVDDYGTPTYVGANTNRGLAPAFCL